MHKHRHPLVPLMTGILVLAGCSSAAEPAASSTSSSASPPSTASATVSETAPGTSSAAVSETATMRTIVDQHDKKIQIPATVDRVAPSIGAFAQITTMLGGETKLVASVKSMSEMFYTVWPKANPDRRDVSNIEEIIAGKAQVAFGPNFSDEQKAQLEGSGIPVATIDSFATVDQMKSTVTLIADILGGDAPERAKAFNAGYDKNIALVSDRTKDVPDGQRVKVLNLRYGGDAYSSVGKNDISASYVRAAGGINVSDDLKDSGSGIDAEQIIAWAPDVIYTMGQSAREKILSDPALASVPAVANKKVFTEPSGTYPWSVRSAEGALMPLFLATIIYPDKFKDLSLAQQTKDFYKNFYDYQLTDAQVQTILAGSK